MVPNLLEISSARRHLASRTTTFLDPCILLHFHLYYYYIATCSFSFGVAPCILIFDFHYFVIDRSYDDIELIHINYFIVVVMLQT
jgi:hypothetical protein